MTPEERKAYKAKWRAENREKCLASERAWREKNREKVRAYFQAYRLKHPEKVKADTEARRLKSLAHPGLAAAKRKEAHRKYRDKHFGKILESDEARIKARRLAEQRERFLEYREQKKTLPRHT